MKCKFCGCSDREPCQIPLIFVGQITRLASPGQLAEAVEPCAWLLDNVCTAPLCVDKAYLEAWGFLIA